MRSAAKPGCSAQFPLAVGLLPVLLTLVLGAASAALADPTISWTPSSVEETLLLGQSREVPVSFSVAEDLSNVILRLVPDVEPFVKADPPAFGNLVAGQTVNLIISMSAPMSSPPRTIHGTLQLRSGSDPGRAFAQPLPITLHIATTPPPISVGPVTVEPSRVEVDSLTEVRVTAVVTGPDVIPGSVHLERLNLDGSVRTVGVLHDRGTNADAVAGDGVFSVIRRFQERETGRIRLRVSATFGGRGRAFSDVFTIPVGVLLQPGAGATIPGPNGTSLSVAPDSIPYEVLVGLALPPASDLVAPTGNLPLAGAVEVIFQPTALQGTFPPPSVPLQLTVPAPPGTPEGTEFILGQQTLIDSIEGEPGLRRQLLAVDTATAIGGNIVTQANLLPGILGGGLFAVLEATGSGFARGTASQQICFLFICLTLPRPGVVVSNNTNTLVSVTNSLGQYTLFISGGPFAVTGFDPFRGSSGSTSGNIAVPGATVTANILLVPLAAPPITRDGVRNGGFERCDASGWATTGAVSAVQQLGPTSTGVVIRPTEGQCMVDINTGPGSVGGVGSSLKQRFIVPAAVRTLQLDFNFVSEEFPEFVGSIFNDTFRALITTPDGQTQFAHVSVNQSGGFTLIGDCFFTGGDSTCGQTGWRQASVDLSAFAGTNTPITVELLFSANDAGDNIFDTHALVDNIRFGTVWLDAKIISGATAGQARIQGEVLQAIDILSQAGLNVQLRNTQTIADPGGLLDTDVTWTTGPGCADGRVNGRLTAEESQLLGLSRSATATDLNAYYVRSLTGLGALAIAIGPDDFCVDVNILTNSGVIMSNTVFPETLAHEMGHILISPETAGSVLEHAAPDVNNIMHTPRSVPRTVLTRAQSASINRPGAPLLVP